MNKFLWILLFIGIILVLLLSGCSRPLYNYTIVTADNISLPIVAYACHTYRSPSNDGTTNAVCNVPPIDPSYPSYEVVFENIIALRCVSVFSE